MQREYIKWWSPSLNRDMELLAFGHAGTPVLAFPSSLGRFYEWEDFEMVEALRPQLEGGQNMLICIDSIDAEALYNKHVHPRARVLRYLHYEQYVLTEVLPFIRDRSGQDFVIAAGASFGAYHAANLVFKQPWKFGKLIALSGAFDVKMFMDGFYDESVYFNNPVDYLPNLEDHHTLEAIRRNHIILTYGEYDPCRDANERISGILHGKGIGHHVDFLDGAFGHDWPWWKDLMARHIG